MAVKKCRFVAAAKEIAKKHEIDWRTAREYARSDTRPIYTQSNPKASKRVRFEPSQEAK
jgi:hypothetical protein